MNTSLVIRNRRNDSHRIINRRSLYFPIREDVFSNANKIELKNFKCDIEKAGIIAKKNGLKMDNCQQEILITDEQVLNKK